MSTFPVTPEGHRKIKEELHRLKTVERPRISHDIGVAIEMGDLSENFEYHSAKDKQGMIEARVRILEDQVSRSQVIDPTSLSGDRVVFGATVTLLYIDTDEEKIYQIVGEPTASVEKGRINVASPLARALIGKEIGDEVKVPGKGGPKLVEISEVEYK